MRVRRREMDLRADLDSGDAGNTCCIIKPPFPKGVQKAYRHFNMQKFGRRERRSKAGQASMRVRRRVMDLRADLDNGDAGNTCCIIKSPLFKGVRKGALSCVPA